MTDLEIVRQALTDSAVTAPEVDLDTLAQRIVDALAVNAPAPESTLALSGDDPDVLA